MAAHARPLGSTESLPFFVKARRVVGWLAVVTAATTFVSLFLDAAVALALAFCSVVSYGAWLLLVVIERREALRDESRRGTATRQEIAAERAEFKTGIGIGSVLLAASVLTVGLVFGSQWLGLASSLLFLYLLVIGGPFWLAEILARGEDARRRPR